MPIAPTVRIDRIARPGPTDDRRQPRRPSGTSRDTSRDSTSRNDRLPTTTTAATKPLPIPGPLSDADIAKLSRDQAMLEWTNRKRVATQSGIDDAVKHRLIDESEKARARMLEAGGGQ